MSNFIQKIEDGGKLIILDDSSKWEVNFLDTSTTRMWMTLEKVSVSLTRMTNLNRNQTVSVMRKF